MVTDLVQIRRLGEQKRSENERFRKYLKSHSHSDRRFRRFAEEIEDAIDCTQCANCCRVTEVEITDRDIAHLAKELGVTVADFHAQYTGRSQEGELILKRTEQGCVFLEGNLCSVYDARPHNCVNFPHLVRGEGSMVSRMWRLTDRATFCPIVYNWMEVAKEDAGFRR